MCRAFDRNCLSGIVIGIIIIVLAGSTFVEAVTFPIKVSQNKRYLVDANNNPFLWNGETPWYLPIYGTKAQITAYLDDRVAKGFTVIVCHLTTEDPDQVSIEGLHPFQNKDLTKPNEAWFQKLDWFVQTAASKGLLMNLNPVWSHGYGPAGLLTTSNMATFGTWIANRYKNMNNVTWFLGGDHGYLDCWAAMGAAIKAVDPDQLMLHHGIEDQFNNAAWLGINGVYSYQQWIPEEMYSAYSMSPTRPTLHIEGEYENGNLSGEYGTPVHIRSNAYWAMLTGVCGATYGNWPIWNIGVDWEAHLNDPGAVSLQYMPKLFGSLQWWTLIPDQQNQTMTAGQGNGMSRAVCARSADGSLGIAYFPSQHTSTFAISRFSGAVTARWYDPTDGTFRTITGSPFANTGTRQFTTPGSNKAGNHDWVLVLETAGATRVMEESAVPHRSVNETTVGHTVAPATYGIDGRRLPGWRTISGPQPHARPAYRKTGPSGSLFQTPGAIFPQ